MTYVKGSWAHHQPSSEPEGDPARTCLYDGEPWPCDPAALKADLIAAVLEKVQPKTGQPQCCDVHADRHEALEDLAEEIKEL